MCEDGDADALLRKNQDEEHFGASWLDLRRYYEPRTIEPENKLRQVLSEPRPFTLATNFKNWERDIREMLRQHAAITTHARITGES